MIAPLICVAILLGVKVMAFVSHRSIKKLEHTKNVTIINNAKKVFDVLLQQAHLMLVAFLLAEEAFAAMGLYVLVRAVMLSVYHDVTRAVLFALQLWPVNIYYMEGKATIFANKTTRSIIYEW